METSSDGCAEWLFGSVIMGGISLLKENCQNVDARRPASVNPEQRLQRVRQSDSSGINSCCQTTC